MTKFSWDHVHMRTADPEAMGRWFAEILGAEIVRSTAARTDVKIGGAGLFISNVSDADGVGPAPSTPHRGLDHFGLTVDNLDEIVAALRGKGVAFSKEPATVRPGVRVCFLRGPEGISIELLERKMA